VSTNAGANIQLYGSTHISGANDFKLRADTSDVIAYDDSSSTLTLLPTAGTASAVFTNTTAVFGVAGSSYGLRHVANDQLLFMASGTSSAAGANLLLYGNTHATLANDFKLRADSTEVVHYDHSSTALKLNADTRIFSNSAGTEQARINSDGDLIIGTTAPVSGERLYLYNSTSGYLMAGDGTATTIYGADATNSGFCGTFSNHDFKIRTNNTVIGTWTTGGNLLIGTTTDDGILVQLENGTTGGEILRVRCNQSGGVQQTALIGFAHNDGLTNPSALIGAEEFSVSDSRAHLVFSTRASNSDVVPVEGMRLTNASNLLIGATSDYSIEAAPLQVTGNIVAGTTATGTGLIRMVGNRAAATGSSVAGMVMYNSTTLSAGVVAVEDGSGNTAIAFNTNPSAYGERARITSGGNLLIGTTTDSNDTAGGLTVNGSIVSNTHPTNKNVIIGGDFTTNPWQRGTSAAGVTGVGYVADRWQYAESSAAVVTINKQADAPTAAQAGVYTQHCHQIDVTTADASMATTDYVILRQYIEGYNFARFGFGQAGTRYVTISFWVKAFRAGTYTVAIVNGAANRTYVKEYTIDSAGTWEKKTLTFPADSTGTWVYDNGYGAQIIWTIAIGSDKHGTADQWNADSKFSTANQVNSVQSTDDYFRLALVQLEAGEAATTFESRDAQTERNLCARYYQEVNVFHGATNVWATAYNSISLGFMRGTPTLTAAPNSGSGAVWTLATTSVNTPLTAYQTTVNSTSVQGILEADNEL
jgi:hypothetical protein